MQTHDGPFGIFWATVQLDNAPLMHLTRTLESEWPYRRSWTPCLRLPGGQGLLVGWWRRSRKDEDEALLDVLNGRTYGSIKNNAVTAGGD